MNNYLKLLGWMVCVTIWVALLVYLLGGVGAVLVTVIVLSVVQNKQDMKRVKQYRYAQTEDEQGVTLKYPKPQYRVSNERTD